MSFGEGKEVIWFGDLGLIFKFTIGHRQLKKCASVLICTLAPVGIEQPDMHIYIIVWGKEPFKFW